MAPDKAGPPEARRLVHPFALIFFFGGILGAAINLGLAAGLYYRGGIHPLLAIFLGTLANQIFHFLYYSVVFVNREIRWRGAPGWHFLLYVAAAASSSALLWIFLKAGLGPVPSAIAVLGVLSLANAFLVRIVHFSTARLAAIEYQAMDESYYDDHTDAGKVGRFRAWFHRSRFVRLTQFVDEHYRPGMSLADLGCGNCWWNTGSLPVTGVDINEKMLGWAQRHGRVKDFRVCTDLSRTSLPENHFDVVVMSETLEHLLQLVETVNEVRRILKPGGVFLVTVPYDFFLSPFFILFNIHCVIQGYLLGSVYHKYRCGHINHFTKRRLRRLLAENGFRETREFVVNGMTLYAAAVKETERAHAGA
jgi:ubiquinone/menaquinone biosynthesis C-methylase UbiE